MTAQRERSGPEHALTAPSKSRRISSISLLNSNPSSWAFSPSLSKDSVLADNSCVAETCDTIPLTAYISCIHCSYIRLPNTLRNWHREVTQVYSVEIKPTEIISAFAQNSESTLLALIHVEHTQCSFINKRDKFGI